MTVQSINAGSRVVAFAWRLHRRSFGSLGKLNLTFRASSLKPASVCSAEVEQRYNLIS